VAVVFFTVSGGAYGLEPLVGAVGPAWAVALVVLAPIAWSVPIALVAAELSSALPAEGGYYVWVRRGLGDFWGVQEGWWTMAYSAVDMAIYPVLFVDYLTWFVPSLALDASGHTHFSVLAARWAIAVAVVMLALWNNSRGARAVGRIAIVNAFVVLVPFAILTAIGFSHGGAWHAIATGVTPHASGLWLLGLSTVLWNYCGWDNVSTFAGEVEDPRRNYPRALGWGVVLIALVYLLPLIAGLEATTDPKLWSESQGWPAIARVMAGPWLGAVIALAALASAWSLFDGQLLYVSRLPWVMARDGWLPRALARVSPRTGVPMRALFVACAVTALFTALPFGKLVVLDIALYSTALLLELVALVALRRSEPELERPFRIGGGAVGLALVAAGLCASSGAVAFAGFRDASTAERVALGLVLVSGAVLYRVRRVAASSRAT
jgi:amino acid transporter